MTVNLSWCLWLVLVGSFLPLFQGSQPQFGMGIGFWTQRVSWTSPRGWGILLLSFLLQQWNFVSLPSLRERGFLIPFWTWYSEILLLFLLWQKWVFACHLRESLLLLLFRSMWGFVPVPQQLDACPTRGFSPVSFSVSLFLMKKDFWYRFMEKSLWMNIKSFYVGGALTTPNASSHFTFKNI